MTLGVLWAVVAASAIASFALPIGLWESFERRVLATGSIARF